MILEPISSTLVASAVAVIGMVFMLFFLPAIIELRNPKDGGPRMLVDNPAKITLGMLKIPIVDLEESEKLTSEPALINAVCLYAIPNLES